MRYYSSCKLSATSAAADAIVVVEIVCVRACVCVSCLSLLTIQKKTIKKNLEILV